MTVVRPVFRGCRANSDIVRDDLLGRKMSRLKRFTSSRVCEPMDQGLGFRLAFSGTLISIYLSIYIYTCTLCLSLKIPTFGLRAGSDIKGQTPSAIPYMAVSIIRRDPLWVSVKLEPYRVGGLYWGPCFLETPKS